ncbi:hypothetical protein HK107_01625 [Parvularcula sp. ZS-1/3]|uniref:Uncharacterized protein n=1 Tax=Parvularcula mediterranea TaxID=2732508 RepID=A0A7Y3W415_9PROT|nr:hypothetical protein [Parvularcula mediterranea]NNU15023.1 hypothetical protein [Parvularcula mediterranea]
MTTEQAHADAALQAREDLAFMRGIVSDGRPFARNTGGVYFWSGIIYGTQCLINLVDLMAGQVLPPIVLLLNGIVPTVLFVGVLVYALSKRKPETGPKGPVARAIEMAFQGTGLANLALVVVFGVAAFQRQDMSIWFFYPVTVLALQGAVWYGAGRLRRRSWMLVVAAGWLLASIVCGLNVENLTAYLGALCVTLYGLMAVPGYVLMQISKDGVTD